MLHSLGRKLTLTGLLLMLAIAASGFQDKWTSFSSPEGGFSILLPGQPEYTTESKDSPIGPYTNHLFSVAVNNYRGMYIFGWVDYQPNVALDVKTEINANRDNFVKGMNAKVLSETTISLDGNPGIEFTADNDKYFTKARVYIKGQRPYLLAAGFLKGFEDYPGAEKFLTSFTFVTKASPATPSGKP